MSFQFYCWRFLKDFFFFFVIRQMMGAVSSEVFEHSAEVAEKIMLRFVDFLPFKLACSEGCLSVFVLRRNLWIVKLNRTERIKFPWRSYLVCWNLKSLFSMTDVFIVTATKFFISFLKNVSLRIFFWEIPLEFLIMVSRKMSLNTQHWMMKGKFQFFIW